MHPSFRVFCLEICIPPFFPPLPSQMRILQKQNKRNEGDEVHAPIPVCKMAFGWVGSEFLELYVTYNWTTVVFICDNELVDRTRRAEMMGGYLSQNF